MQQHSGNSVARRHAGDVSSKSPQKPGVQRFLDFSGGASLYEDFTPEQIRDAIDKKSAGDLIYMTNFKDATPAQRDQIVEIILAQADQFASYKVGLALQYLWNSYGTDLLTLDPARARLFQRCTQKGMHIANIKVINEQLKPLLISDTREIAKGYIESNINYLSAQMTQLGYFNQGDMAAGKKQEIDNVQSIAKEVKEGQAMLDALKKTPVGYEESWTNYIRPAEAMMFDPTPILTDVTFDPEKKPRYESYGESYPPPKANWEQVNAQYQLLYAAVAQKAGQSPAVYRAWVEGKLDQLSDTPPETANHAAMNLVVDAWYDLLRARNKIGGVDALDMLPIISQLTHGDKTGQSGLNWSNPFLAAAANGLVEKNKLENLISNIGLAAVGTIAFIMAEAATGGLATFALTGVGLGASAAQAWESIPKAVTYNQLAGGATSEQTRIITQGQASDATLSAVLDSVGLFLDGIGAVGSFGRASAAMKIDASVNAMEAITKIELKTLNLMAPDVAASTIRRGIDQYGIEETAKLAGLSHPEELLPFVRNDPDMLGRIRAFTNAEDAAVTTGKGAVQGAQEGLLRVAKGELTDPQIVEQLLNSGIDAMGTQRAITHAGGWERLKAILPEESAAGKRLFAWRDDIYRDLEVFVTNQLKGEIEHTGTYKNFKNDLDMTFKGQDAARNRELALQYLEKRTGFRRDELGKNMLADLFTDASRVHIYDELPAAERLAVAQTSTVNARNLIYNRMLLDAQKEGPEAVLRIEQKMADLGIPKIENFRLLSKEERVNMSMVIDSLHKEFNAATEPAKRREIAEKIAHYQSQINVSEGGGYMSGGGVAEWVTNREAREKKQNWFSLTDAPRATDKVDAIGNLYDQFGKLEHAMQALANAKTEDEVLVALRDIGKYGFRNALGQLPFASSHLDELSLLMDEFSKIKSAVDRGGVDVAALTTHAEAMFKWLDADSSKMLLAAADEAGLAGVKVDMNLLMAAMDQQKRVMQLKEAAKKGLLLVGIGLDAKGAAVGYQSGNEVEIGQKR
jgi:hypothetical protein